MPVFPFGETAWVVLVLAIAIGLAAATIGVVWTFEQRLSRLPYATRLDGLREQATAIDEKVKVREEELRRLDQKIHDRDRLAGEVAALVERIEAMRAELAGLAGAEQQIDAVKQRAADAAEAYATEMAKLDEVRTAREEMEHSLRAAETRLATAQRESDRTDERTKAGLARFGEVQEALQRLRDEKAAIEREVAGLDGTRGSLFDARDEAATMAARKQAMQREIEAIGDGIEAASARLDDTHSSLQTLVDKKAAAERELAELQGIRNSLFDIRDETAVLAARKEATKREIETLCDETERLKKLQQGLDPDISGPSVGPSDTDIVRDLLQMPACLRADWSNAHPAQHEDAALHDVTTHLERLGLHYGQRTVFAFHTALKTNDAAQLAVLAGVSGTGKSLLPRRYAEAMGLRFLQIAVEPRWDSPQDVLGFYNYIEKGYRATDLARALVRMDPHNTSGLADQRFGDQMLLVLLDEMNLARVEYYFSEFLSRLEVRPRFDSEGDAEKRSGANLPIDVPGRADGPIRLYPSHNVLFAGTMNDDESTQSLSDKVLDRSNVLQFAAPDQFTPLKGAKPGLEIKHYRSFGEWRKWVRVTGWLQGGERDKATRVIGLLAKIMEDMGRPFGHRLSEAILAYVANYPLPNGGHVNTPLADQVEMRILPKLRGLTINEHKPSFDDLSDLVEKELDDRALTDCLRALGSRQGGGTGQFSWRGFNRGSA